MPNSRAEAFAPATVANLGVGFDILGLAVAGAGDVVVAEYREDPGAVIGSVTGVEAETIPREADKNITSISANALLQELDIKHGVTLHIKKGMRSSSGLGSSAAAAVGGVVAVNALLGSPLEREKLLAAALEGEAAVSGYHADNVAPCLLGGITLTNGIDMTRIRRLPVPDGLQIALITPHVHVPTAEARAALPEHIGIKQLVQQTGAVAEFVDALYRSDIAVMARTMEADTIVEPSRRHLMPHLADVRVAAKRAGALALVISGAGPTLCAVCDDPAIAERVGAAMKQVYNEVGLPSTVRHSGILKGGARVLMVE